MHLISLYPSNQQSSRIDSKSRLSADPIEHVVDVYEGTCSKMISNINNDMLSGVRQRCQLTDKQARSGRGNVYGCVGGDAISVLAFGLEPMLYPILDCIISS